MQPNRCNSPKAYPMYRMSSWVRSLRLEDEDKRETHIRNLENQISRGQRRGEAVDSLIKQKEEAYNLWISQLNEEINGELNDDIKRDRERKLDDAIQKYGPHISS